MNVEALRGSFTKPFRDVIRTAVVKAFRTAAGKAGKQYEPSNGHLFGTVIYTFCCPELKKLAHRSLGVPVRLRETSSALDFKLEVGYCVVACQPVTYAANPPDGLGAVYLCIPAGATEFRRGFGVTGR